MQFQEVGWPEFASVAPELLPIYRPDMTGDSPAAAIVLREWMSYTGLPGWRCVVSRASDRQPATGFAMGHIGTPANSWHHLTRIALLRSGLPVRVVDDYLRDYFIVAEVHVSVHAQGQGIGAQLVRDVIGGWPGALALTVRETNESHPSRAWRLYRSFGFVPVARDLRIAGSSQRFAVMHRSPPAQWSDPASAVMAHQGVHVGS